MIGIVQCCVVCCTVLYIILYFTLATVLNQRTSMAGLKNSSPGFAYAIDSKEGGYVLKISNAAAIVVRNEVTGSLKLTYVDALQSVPTFLMQKFMSPCLRLFQMARRL